MGPSRTAVSHSQRIALRHYYQTANPKPTQSALQMWFKSHFGHEISQSMVSRSLSDSFAHLDIFAPTSQVVSEFRVRTCQWPWLDLLLSDWLDAVERQSGKVSNDVIKRKARQIWKDSDKSQGLAMPKFSTGWVAKFRKRHEIRHRSRQNQHSVLLEEPDHFISKQDSSKSQREPMHAPPGTVIVLSPQSKAATRHVSANGTSSHSQLNTSTTLPLSSDHLIHLIQHNVLRALLSNKSLLRSAASFLKGANSVAYGNESTTQLCGGLTVVRPLPNQNIPDTLYPTILQMNCVHTSWIDMFPFPRFRDNLIKKGSGFVLEKMRQDLCGDIFPDFISPSPANSTVPSAAATRGAHGPEFEQPDDYTAGRRCLINWGEPWKVESWEATPGFLENWGWALEGCDDLIQASNRWRIARNEEPLRL
ncbi:uncharacterized protein NECHADRAFT_75804 [Fusarium vanettenii 77-13-4]|uniref:HTH CENPB-type domain-containing protein n=1 Tax=Fusarium vanettenii (strain ATCC MYA-4622 / CBS 123669 / FGSC 9596 / NRRL 45880 / 77-13-4) TaxID=660122 RepID=C7YJU8_FUSV7|nr:uncharacterized protein NECHADRAFT_75804 [Fusarium vanettenii 77-13-4]EEU49040.1 hypothetical protein NECHADRAFT_75804 [Fusarium vanettenii 77-13-4]